MTFRIARLANRLARFLARSPRWHEFLVAAGFSEPALRPEVSKRRLHPDHVRV